MRGNNSRRMTSMTAKDKIDVDWLADVEQLDSWIPWC